MTLSDNGKSSLAGLVAGGISLIAATLLGADYSVEVGLAIGTIVAVVFKHFTHSVAVAAAAQEAAK